MDKAHNSLSLPVAVSFALISSLMPLSAYVFSLSLFGIPHIYYELHYIRERFSPRFPTAFKSAVILVLIMICACSTTALLMPFQYFPETLLFMAALLLVLAYFFAPSLITLALLFLFTTGIVFNPLLVFFTMTFLHNLTPWGFLKERGANGKAWIIFILFPIVVFIITALTALDASFYSQAMAETFKAHYIPLEWQNIDYLRPIFAAAVYLQLIHYDTTIRILPSMMQTKIRADRLVIVFFLLAVCGFIINFKTARSVYSILAGFHAWLEVPILLAVFASYSEMQFAEEKISMSRITESVSPFSD